MGATRQSFLSKCPVNHAGGAGRTDHSLGNLWNNGSQLTNETRPMIFDQLTRLIPPYLDRNHW